MPRLQPADQPGQPRRSAPRPGGPSAAQRLLQLAEPGRVERLPLDPGQEPGQRLQLARPVLDPGQRPARPPGEGRGDGHLDGQQEPRTAGRPAGLGQPADQRRESPGATRPIDRSRVARAARPWRLGPQAASASAAAARPDVVAEQGEVFAEVEPRPEFGHRLLRRAATSSVGAGAEQPGGQASPRPRRSGPCRAARTASRRRRGRGRRRRGAPRRGTASPGSPAPAHRPSSRARPRSWSATFPSARRRAARTRPWTTTRPTKPTAAGDGQADPTHAPPGQAARTSADQEDDRAGRCRSGRRGGPRPRPGPARFEPGGHIAAGVDRRAVPSAIQDPVTPGRGVGRSGVEPRRRPPDGNRGPGRAQPGPRADAGPRTSLDGDRGRP